MILSKKNTHWSTQPCLQSCASGVLLSLPHGGEKLLVPLCAKGSEPFKVEMYSTFCVVTKFDCPQQIMKKGHTLHSLLHMHTDLICAQTMFLHMRMVFDRAQDDTFWH